MKQLTNHLTSKATSKISSVNFLQKLYKSTYIISSVWLNIISTILFSLGYFAASFFSAQYKADISESVLSYESVLGHQQGMFTFIMQYSIAMFFLYTIIKAVVDNDCSITGLKPIYTILARFITGAVIYVYLYFSCDKGVVFLERADILFYFLIISPLAWILYLVSKSLLIESKERGDIDAPKEIS